jgi:hypothetical protein
LTTDQIRLVFKSESSGATLEVTEDELGFKDLILDLPLHLPGCQSEKDWFMGVALPAFKTNWTRIFSRYDSSSRPDPQ